MLWYINGKIETKNSVKEIEINGKIYSPQYLTLKNQQLLAQAGIYPFKEDKWDTDRYESTGYVDELDPDGWMHRYHTIQEKPDALKKVKRTAFSQIVSHAELYSTNNFCLFDQCMLLMALHHPTITPQQKSDIINVFTWYLKFSTEYHQALQRVQNSKTIKECKRHVKDFVLNWKPDIEKPPIGAGTQAMIDLISMGENNV